MSIGTLASSIARSQSIVRPNHRVVAAILFILWGQQQQVHAEDLGKIGPTYAITEKSLVEVIKEHFRRMEKSGELAKFQEDYKSRIIRGIEKPPPVKGVRPTEQGSTHYVDPTWVLDRNIQDANGRIMYAAGTRVNPLDYDEMTKNLLFFDADDKAQLAFAARYIAESAKPVKPILVSGEPIRLMRQWKTPVYFDQFGTLSKRFAIKQIPAIVSQEGKRLRVDSIKPL